MGILLDIATACNGISFNPAPPTLDREKTLDLLELVMELAGQVEHLSPTRLNGSEERG